MRASGQTRSGRFPAADPILRARQLQVQALTELTALAGRDLAPEAFLTEFSRVLTRLDSRFYLGVFSRLDPESTRLFLSDDVANRLPPRVGDKLARTLASEIESLAMNPASHSVAPHIGFTLRMEELPPWRVHCQLLFDGNATEAGASRGGVLGGLLGWSLDQKPHAEEEGFFSQVAGLLRLYLCRVSAGLSLETFEACLELLNDIYRRTLEQPRGVSFTFSRLQQIFGYDLAAMALEDSDCWRVIYRLTPELPATFVQQAKAIMIEAMDRELSVNRGAIKAEHQWDPSEGGRAPETVESFLVLPLPLAEGEVRGLLGFFSGLPDLFTPQQVRLLSLLSPGLAVSIKNSHLVARLTKQNREMTAEIRESDRQLELAREVQTNLVPARAPQPNGLSVGAFYRPVSGVGGDLYDFVEHDGGAFEVFLADVAGKGLSAAMLSSLTKGLLRGLSGAGLAPDVVMGRLNRLLASELTADRFVTAALVSIDAGRRRLSYVTAGHEPLLFYERASGRVHELATRALPLGVDSSFEYVAAGRECAPGDCLLLYTDGALPRGETGGRERLKLQLGRLAPDRPDAGGVAGSLRRAIDQLVGRQHDDVACVVVKVS